ncbi:hypothetical protein DMN98_06720 [Vibrio parahaemolyticus]|nr:hypothetical protein [Vibrio parahaemolyticus]
MEKYLHRVFGQVKNTLVAVDIDLNGRNLIVTGGNGSGKTCFLRELYSRLDAVVIGRQHDIRDELDLQYQQVAERLQQYQQYSDEYKRSKLELRRISDSVHYQDKSLRVLIPNKEEFSTKCITLTAILSFFEADRKSKIKAATAANGVDFDKNNAKRHSISTPLGSKLEQHLVNLRSRRSLAIAEEQNYVLADKISSWFSNFEDNLKLLLEDQTAKLNFNSNSLKFTISQQNKPEYTFQSLSSGYQAIFEIYADMLMRTEYFDVTPQELRGVVLIDEIDVHLHVSLQRLILPFFAKSFPNVQFIVTTHSPFVLMSAEECVIYDLSKGEQIDDDISMYSYTSVIEGLLDTKTTSYKLDKYIHELAEIVNSNDINYSRLETILNKLRDSYNKLDSKSKSFFMKGENVLLDKEL